MPAGERSGALGARRSPVVRVAAHGDEAESLKIVFLSVGLQLEPIGEHRPDHRAGVVRADAGTC